MGDLHLSAPPVYNRGTKGLFLICTFMLRTVNDFSAASFMNWVLECSLMAHKELLHSFIPVIFLNAEIAIRVSEQLEIGV